MSTVTTASLPGPSLWKIDPQHSLASFRVKHMMVSHVTGSFSGIKGELRFDPANPSAASVEAAIDASTVETREAQRDAHLRSADFLDVEHYPTMSFRSTRVQPAGEGELTVEGDLTIRGVTRPVRFSVEGPSAAAKDPYGNTRIGLSARARISRKEFGLAFNPVLETGGVMIGDDLSLTLDVEFIAAGSPA